VNEHVASVEVEPSLDERLAEQGLSRSCFGFPKKGQLFLGRETTNGRRKIYRATEDYPEPTLPMLEILAINGDDLRPLSLDVAAWEETVRGTSVRARELRAVVVAKILNGTPVSLEVGKATRPLSLKDLPWRSTDKPGEGA
jgi:hypothetical protein